MNKFFKSLVFVAAVGVVVPSYAQDLVYTPINPSFGGNPGFSNHLLSTATSQRDATARDAIRRDAQGTGVDPSRPGSTDADLFVRQLQGRLLSGLAAEVTNAIFGADPQDSGTVVFGQTTVTFDRTLDAINLNIIDNLDGTVTEIVVPRLVTGG